MSLITPSKSILPIDDDDLIAGSLRQVFLSAHCDGSRGSVIAHSPDLAKSAADGKIAALLSKPQSISVFSQYLV